MLLVRRTVVKLLNYQSFVCRTTKFGEGFLSVQDAFRPYDVFPTDRNYILTKSAAYSRSSGIKLSTRGCPCRTTLCSSRTDLWPAPVVHQRNNCRMPGPSCPPHTTTLYLNHVKMLILY